MNCIFMGTPLFGKYILERLVKIVNIKLVLCQPDKPSGRSRKVEFSEVKKYSIENNNFSLIYMRGPHSMLPSPPPTHGA